MVHNAITKNYIKISSLLRWITYISMLSLPNEEEEMKLAMKYLSE